MVEHSAFNRFAPGSSPGRPIKLYLTQKVINPDRIGNLLRRLPDRGDGLGGLP
jgi:hypothetical protein